MAASEFSEMIHRIAARKYQAAAGYLPDTKTLAAVAPPIKRRHTIKFSPNKKVGYDKRIARQHIITEIPIGIMPSR